MKDEFKEIVETYLSKFEFYHCFETPNMHWLDAVSYTHLPCSCALSGEKGGQRLKKKYNTPHRCHVVKTRMTEEEYADFTERLKHYDMSQAEFIRWIFIPSRRRF